MVRFLVLMVVFSLMGEVLAEPVQVVSVDENGENGTVISPPSARSSSIPFVGIITLANLVLAVINILMTYWIGRKYNP